MSKYIRDDRELSAKWSKTFEFREGINHWAGVSGENIMAQQFRARVEL